MPVNVNAPLTPPQPWSPFEATVRPSTAGRVMAGLRRARGPLGSRAPCRDCHHLRAGTASCCWRSNDCDARPDGRTTDALSLVGDGRVQRRRPRRGRPGLACARGPDIQSDRDCVRRHRLCDGGRRRARGGCGAAGVQRQLLLPLGVDHFCRFRSSWIEINNDDACGPCGRRLRRPKRGGKRAASAEQAGTDGSRVFHAAGAVHRPFGSRTVGAVHGVDRRRARGSSGPRARPRGAGAGGDLRRDRSVR